MEKEELIKVFEDTKALVLNKITSVEAKTTRHSFSEMVKLNYQHNTNILVLNSDTVSAANLYSKEGKTCLLNMASPSKAGGGVINGAKAQEESLFRCSNLFQTIVQDFYPLLDNEALYTKNAVFFKDRYYNLIDPFTVDVVTIAAFNLNKNLVIKNYEETTKNKMRLMFYLASIMGVENLILGAWGCGVFKNNPETIASYFKEIIEEYKGCFRNIIFAIINDHNSVSDNYQAFIKILDGNE